MAGKMHALASQAGAGMMRCHSRGYRTGRLLCSSTIPMAAGPCWPPLGTLPLLAATDFRTTITARRLWACAACKPQRHWY